MKNKIISDLRTVPGIVDENAQEKIKAPLPNQANK